MVGRPDTASKVEAKYSALRFKQQLTAYVEKIYGMIRDNLKKEINPFLIMCIQVCTPDISMPIVNIRRYNFVNNLSISQAPRAVRVRSSRGSLKSVHSNSLSRQTSSVHWQSIIKCLNHTLETMNNNHVSMAIIVFSCPMIREFSL